MDEEQANPQPLNQARLQPTVPLQTKFQQLLQLPQVRLLTLEQIELALQWLASPIVSPPPETLEELSQLEWYILQSFLRSLQVDRENNPLQ